MSATRCQHRWQAEAENVMPKCMNCGIWADAAPIPPPTPDSVSHPKHYNSHPSGVECITVTEHMGFNLGNAVKYIWRADLKNDAIEDLKKAAWYIERELKRREQ